MRYSGFLTSGFVIRIYDLAEEGKFADTTKVRDVNGNDAKKLKGRIDIQHL